MMAQARILVDGNELLQQWPKLAALQAKHTEAILEELVNLLTQYVDTEGTPITVVLLDEEGLEDIVETFSTPEVEILCVPHGQSPHQSLERLAYRWARHGQVQVVADNFAGREKIHQLGGSALGCKEFIHQLESILNNLEREIEELNQREQKKFSHQ